MIPVVVVGRPSPRDESDVGRWSVGRGDFSSSLVTIAGAAVREGVTAAGGEKRTTAKHQGARCNGRDGGVRCGSRCSGIAGVEERGHELHAPDLYKPLSATAEIAPAGAARALTLTIAELDWKMRNDTAWLRKNNARKWTPLIQDHGKIMHAYGA